MTATMLNKERTLAVIEALKERCRELERSESVPLSALDRSIILIALNGYIESDCCTAYEAVAGEAIAARLRGFRAKLAKD